MATLHSFTSRYDVFGPPSGCPGPCQGTTWVPVYMVRWHGRALSPFGETDPELRRRWERAHRGAHRQRNRLMYLWHALVERDRTWLSMAFGSLKCDGWHFVRCPHCRPGD